MNFAVAVKDLVIASRQIVRNVNLKQSVRMCMNHSELSAAIYVRLSRDDNGEKYDSIKTQQELLQSYVAKHFPDKPVRIYTDDNISGVTFDRPALKQLIDDIKRGLIDALVLKDLSRLGRSNAATLMFLEETELSGVRIITADGRYDSETNSELAGIDSWFNERYVSDISKKIRSNIKQKIESGQYIGTAPYGYRKRTDKVNFLEPDPATAQIVRDIFNLYISGFGYKRIADTLDRRGILPPAPSRSKSLQWNPVTIKRILSNSVYIGTTVQGISKKVSFKSKKTCRLPSDMWTVTAGTHEPLVDAEVWQKAATTCGTSRRAVLPPTGGLLYGNLQSSMANRPGFSVIQHAASINLFKGIIRCALCGGPMIRRISKGRPDAYICARYAKHGVAVCRRNGIRIDTVLKTVAPEIKQIAEKNIALLKKNVVQNHYCENNLLVKEFSQAKTLDTNDLRVKQEKIYSDYLDGKITEELFIRMNKIIETKIAEQSVQAVFEQTEEPSSDVICASKGMSVAIRLIERLIIISEKIAMSGSDGFDELFTEEKYCESADAFNRFLFAEAVRIAVKSIVASPGELTVTYRFTVG
ncbi:MAG: recombinase family protein [Ruminococcaceae bacterium]|nr:recombinase family protein [Oscillospiraceae bacterium]